MSAPRDHGGGIDAAAARYGGTRADWLDLSTGINPVPYPVETFPPEVWTQLPDTVARDQLLDAARRFWNVPDGVGVLAAPGASALIARLPQVLGRPGRAFIASPTYNEWEASFRHAGWSIVDTPEGADVAVYVHPNNPDGALAPEGIDAPCVIYDESFADCAEAALSRVPAGRDPRVVVVKSFGKFWGLAGLRLGALVGPPELLQRMSDALGPWPVSGPALALGACALADSAWAADTRARLKADSMRLDTLMRPYRAAARGTTLFRLYDLEDASALHVRLAEAQIWSRVFPYNPRWLRLGLPGTEADWMRLQAALEHG